MTIIYAATGEGLDEEVCELRWETRQIINQLRKNLVSLF